MKFSLEDLAYLEEADTCDNGDEHIPSDLEGQMALIPTSVNKTANCTIGERAQIIQGHKGGGLLADAPMPSKFNASDYDTINIPVAALYYPSDKATLLSLKKKHPKAEFFLYAPEESEKKFDFSLVVILLMAVFSVGIGSIWSGYTKQYL